MLACSAGSTFADVTVSGGSSTVQLDSQPNPNGSPLVYVLPSVTVRVNNGQALFGQNRAWQVDNSGTLTSLDANTYAVYLQNGTRLTNRVAGSLSGVGGGLTIVNAQGALDNFGSISASVGPGVQFRAGGTVTNEREG